MTEHNAPDGPAPISLGGRPLDQRITEAMPELVPLVLERIVRELPEYAQLPQEQLGGDISQIIEHCMDLFASTVRHRRPPRTEDLARLRDMIAQRAEEGVPIEAVLHAHHIGLQACWDAFVVDLRPDEVDSAVQLNRLQLGYLREVTAAVSAGYVRHQQVVLDEEHAARQALLTALLDGASTSEAAVKAGVQLPRCYFVLHVGLADHHDETRPEVNRAVASHRKLRRLRAELTRLAQTPVLSTLASHGGVVLVPAPSTVDEPSEPEWRWLSALISSASRAAGSAITAGAVAAGPPDVPEASRTARQLLTVAVATGRDAGVHRLDDMPWEFQIAHPGAARDRLAGLLDPLRDRPELLETLRIYFRLALNRRQTAQRLHVHPNTVDYRLRKIAKLTGLDTTMPTDLPRIGAALVAHQAQEVEQPTGAA